jgi:hypothetical protein
VSSVGQHRGQNKEKKDPKTSQRRCEARHKPFRHEGGLNRRTRPWQRLQWRRRRLRVARLRRLAEKGKIGRRLALYRTKLLRISGRRLRFRGIATRATRMRLGRAEQSRVRVDSDVRTKRRPTGGAWRQRAEGKGRLACSAASTWKWASAQ